MATTVDIPGRPDVTPSSIAVDGLRENCGLGPALEFGYPRRLFPILMLVCAYATLHGGIALCTPRYEPTPHNDDWAYATPVQTLCEKGEFRLHRLSGALAIPQILAGWAVCEVGGFSFSLLRSMMVVHGIVPILLFWYLLRTLGFPRSVAMWGSLLFLVNPIVVSLTWSFQTDLVYVSFTLAAVIAILVADRDGKAISLVVAALFLLLACLTRQSGIFVAAAVAAYLALRQRWTWAFVTLLVIPMTFVAEQWLVLQSSLIYLPLAKEHVRQALSDLSLGRIFHSVYESLHVLLFLGLALLPLLVISGVGRKSYRGVVAVLMTAILLAGIYLLDAPNKRSVLLGNYVYVGERWGVGPATLEISNSSPLGVAVGGEATPAVRMLGLLGFVGGCFLLPTLAFTLVRLWEAIRRWRPDPQTLVELAFWASLAGIIACTALIGHVLVDRYVILLCPLATPLCLRPNVSARRLLVATLPVCVLLAYLAWAGTVDYWRWNAARWEAAAWLESQGISPDRIDGGYEYNAIHGTLGLPPEIMRPVDWRRRAEIMKSRQGKDTYCLRFRPRQHEDAIAKFPYESPTMWSTEAIYVTRQRPAKPQPLSISNPRATASGNRRR